MALAEELEDLRELRGEFQRPLQGRHRVGELAVLHEELAEPEVPQFVVGVVGRHLAELGDTISGGTHGGVSLGVAVRSRQLFASAVIGSVKVCVLLVSLSVALSRTENLPARVSGSR